jgi:GT2 family glycosyltransferase
MQPFVSIVVPSYNRAASLRRLLESLSRQTYPRDRFEVLVVDDGSTDGTVEYVRRLTVPYTLRLVEQAHGGPSLARNTGVERAQGSVILFIDDDVVPVPELIAEHVAARNGAPNTVVVGPMLPPTDWPRGAWVRWGERHLQEQYDAMVAGKWSCSPRQFYTANVSVPRDRFLECGGFDTSFKRNEDQELGFRLHALGVNFVFNPKAEILHYADHSFEKWSRAAYQYGRYDVTMHREKGLPALIAAEDELHGRNVLLRILVRCCVGRPGLVSRTVRLLADVVQVSDRVHLDRPTMAALSAIFGVMYWQGVADELGSRELLWRRVAASGPRTMAAQASG